MPVAVVVVAHGLTRTVLLVGNYAIKLPTLQSAELFLCGCLGNILEYRRWHESNNDPRLAKVYYCAPLGLFAVQRRYFHFLHRALTEQERATLPFRNIDNGSGTNCAWHNGHIVVCDYGNQDQSYLKEYILIDR
jgi:hypothetical protein